MPKVQLTLTAHHPAQAKVVSEARRFNILACGRRFGKTTLGIERIVHPALEGYPVAWFAPIHKMLTEVWREAIQTLKPVIKRSDAGDHRIELITSGVLDMWSLDSPNTARGRKYKRVVIDEAAMVPALKAAWQEVIRPTLTDWEGDAWFLSTPKGLNFFKELFDMGRDPFHTAYKSWQMPTLANPHIKPSEVEAARLELPEQVFQQEYLAEFLQNEGAVFRNIEKNMSAPFFTNTPRYMDVPAAHEGHTIVLGGDWGQKNDFTVLSALCVDCKAEVELDRFNKIGWSTQRDRIHTIWQKWKIKRGFVETNSIGGPNLEALQEGGLPVSGFETTTSSKPLIIRALALALEREEVAWLPDQVAKAELIAYESKVNTNTGYTRYSAPEGQHDDTVIARALALQSAFGSHAVISIGGNTPWRPTSPEASDAIMGLLKQNG